MGSIGLSAPPDAKLKVLSGELILADEEVKILTIENPFDPRIYTVTPQPWREGLTVANVMAGPQLHPEYVISINGGIIEPENYAVTVLKPADRMVLCPVPQGGDTGKTILRLIAMIVVVVFAWWAAPLLVGAFGGTAAVWAAGMTMAGSMLVNALMPAKPMQSSTADNPDISTYGIDGPKNSSTEGIPVPVCYGKHRQAGNIIGLYIENVDTTQLVHMLINAGEGPVYRLDEIELNGQPLSTFKNVEFETRLGTGNQDLIDWFHDSFTARTVNAKIPDDGSYLEYTTPGECDRLRFDFVAPSGIWQADKKSGALKLYSVPLLIEYSRAGANDWQVLSDHSEITSSQIDDIDADTFPGDGVSDINPDDGFGSQNHNDGTGARIINYQSKSLTSEVTYQTKTIITDKVRAAVRRSFSTKKLAFSHWDVRIKRLIPNSTDEYISDDVFLGDLNEVTSSNVAYNWTALVAIKVKLTDQLNGLPNVTFMNHGRIVRVWDRVDQTWGYSNSRNPAWHALDMLSHWRYGGQMTDDRVDMEMWKTWAKECEDNDWEFNGLLESSMNIWDALQFVCRMGHAQIVNVGTRYSVAIERADTPVMMFGVGNIAKGSFKLNWLPLAERANEISVTFFDRNDSYKQKTIKVYDPVILSEGKPQRPANITLYGCTSETQAVKEAVLHLNLNKYILQTCEFEAPVEALACTVGSLIYVQHDMPAWESSGRLAAGSSANVVKLDRPVDFESGVPYKLLTIYPIVEVGSGTVTAVDHVNGYLMLSSALPSNFKRIVINGADIACQVANTSNASFVWVDSTVGISNGDTYTLFDSDVIVEAEILNTGGQGMTEVQLAAPLEHGAPEEYAHWMIGPVSRVKRPFRVKAITMGANDLKRVLSCVQYDERAYDLDTSNYHGPDGETGGPGDTGFALSNVENLDVFEEVFVSGTNVRTRVVLTWTPPQYGVYQGSEIWLGVGDDPIKKRSEITGTNRFVMDADVGTVLNFKVVAFDVFGRRVNHESAPTLEYTVTGIATTPPVTRPPSGLWVDWQGRDCKLHWRYNSSNNSFEFGNEPYGADSGALDPSVLDFEIKVWHNTNDEDPLDPVWVFKRTEYSTRPGFTYAWEMNVEDGADTEGARRHLKFEVRVRMRVGATSSASAVEAYNEPIDLMTVFTDGISFESAAIRYLRPDVSDFEGAMIYLSKVTPVVRTDENLIFDGPDSRVAITGLDSGSTYYAEIGGYDTFGKRGMVFQPLTFNTSEFDIGVILDGVIGIDLLDVVLRQRIDLVDGDMPGSVNARILGEAVERGAAVLAEQEARQSDVLSLATKSDTVYAALVGVGSAAAQEAMLALMTADGGMASIVDALSVAVDGNHAAILSEAIVRADADSASSSLVTTLTSTVNLKNRTFYQASAPTSTAGYTLVTGDVWIDTDEGNKYNRWTGAAWTYIENPEAIKNRTFAQTTAPASSSSYTLRDGDIWINTSNNNILLRWNGTSWVTVADARISSATASISELFTTTDGLSAQYTVKIDNNGYVTGFGLASALVTEEDNAGQPFWRMISTFEVISDSFQVRPPGSLTGGQIPFTVGQHTDPVTGVTSSKVIVSHAFIGDATIGNAAITGDIRSDDYAAGTAGWMIDKDGNAEFGSLQIRGFSTGSATLENNTSTTIVHGLGRSPVITAWRSGGTGVATLTAVSSTSFTIELTSSSGGTVSWSYL